MARFRRWYRRRYGRRSYYRLRRYRRRYRKFVNGSSRSRVRVKVPVTFSTSLTVAANAHLSEVLTVTPFYSNDTHTNKGKNALRGGLLSSPLFHAYGALYDAFKLDGMKVQVAITSAIGPGGSFPSLSCLTAWDRQFQPTDWDTSAHYPNAGNIRTASSFIASTALNNSITKLTRSSYASDLLEKAGFLDCDYSHATTTVNGEQNQDVYFFNSQGQNIATSRLPPYAPAFMFCIDTGGNVNTAAPRDCELVVEIMYYVTFRNPKYGGSGSSAQVAAVPRYSLDDDDGDDMDDHPDIDSVAESMDAEPPKPPSTVYRTEAAAQLTDTSARRESRREAQLMRAAIDKERNNMLRRALAPQPPNE